MRHLWVGSRPHQQRGGMPLVNAVICSTFLPPTDQCCCLPCTHGSAHTGCIAYRETLSQASRPDAQGKPTPPAIIAAGSALSWTHCCNALRAFKPWSEANIFSYCTDEAGCNVYATSQTLPPPPFGPPTVVITKASAVVAPAPPLLSLCSATDAQLAHLPPPWRPCRCLWALVCSCLATRLAARTCGSAPTPPMTRAFGWRRGSTSGDHPPGCVPFGYTLPAHGVGRSRSQGSPAPTALPSSWQS